MDLARELLVNRYLLSAVLSNLYKLDTMVGNKLNQIAKEKKNEKKISSTPPKRKVRKKEKEDAQAIYFERFSILPEQYQALIEEYGVEITTEACVMLDGYLKTTNTNLKDNFKKLKEWAIHLVMKERLSNLRADIMEASNDFNVEQIEDKVTALKYINSVPRYKRNIDKGVKYLVDKFKLGDENGSL